MQTAAIAREREQNRQEAYRRFEYDRMRTDEITDASERIALPMDNPFEYEIGNDGHLYYQGQSIGRILDKGLDMARMIAYENPSFAREYLHRQIERQEYDEQLNLALGGDENDVLLVISPQVKEIGKKLTMVRLYQRTDDGLRAASISFETSNNESLAAIASLFGEHIGPEESPEDILSRRFRASSKYFLDNDIRRLVARAHDLSLSDQFGGQWSGGRQGDYTLDAQTFILAQEDLLSDHLALMWELKKKGESEDSPAREQARFNFAAALSRRLRGDSDASSLEAAGEAARANNEVYENSCPTGTMLTAPESLERLGLIRREWKHGSCRSCKDVFNPQKVVGECDVCQYCENADNEGKLAEVSKRADDILRTMDSSRDTGRSAVNETVSEVLKQKTNRLPDVKQLFGELAVIRTVIVFGGAEKVVFNKLTNEELGKL